MARADLRRPENVAGDFYVDGTCIDCDTCRWMAPEVFDRAGSQSRVHAQPTDADQALRAAQALVSCPTASIGGAGALPMAEAVAGLPAPIAPDSAVAHCGFHAEASFGAASYLLRREAGNVLVDSPRFAAPLVKRLEELGGVSTLFLSHKDDVADHERFASHFGCERVLHERDLTSGTRGVERVLTGAEPIALAEDLLAIPVPGHTAGSVCLAHADTHLFTGDHLAWSARLGQLYAFRTACWFDWDEQIVSMRRLAEHAFEWVLPGHGQRARIAPGDRAAAMARCVSWMEAA